MSELWSPSGLIERDYSSYPSGYLAHAPSAPDDWLVPQNERAELLKLQQARKASLYDLRDLYYSFLRSLNQTNHPLCWAFSSTKSTMYALAASGTPELLSAWWTAGVSNGWRNQGGWGAQSTEGLAEAGGLLVTDCPNFTSQYDNAANRAKAKKRRVIEWYDGSNDRAKNRDIMISAFLLGLSPTLDYNHLGHSMAGCRLVSLDPLVVDCDNSWDAIEQYGEKGLYRLKGNQAIPDGIVVPRVMNPCD